MHWWNGQGHMGIWWVVSLALLVFGAWALRRSSQGPTSGLNESPEQILKRRYAKGEIDQATYQRMLSELKD